MSTHKRFALLALVALVAMALALPAAAKDKTMTIIDDEGVTYVCSYVDGEYLKVINQDTGEEVLDFDLEDLEDTIEEAMEDVEEALEELEDMDLNIHFGDDSFLRFESGDERIFVDVDGIITTVTSALSSLGEMDIHVNDFEWNHDGDHHHSRHRDRDHEETLKEEIERLRDEVQELRDELHKAERRAKH